MGVQYKEQNEVKALANKESENQWQTVTTSQLAVILGVSDSRIRQLERSGAVTKIARGKYDLPSAIQQYIKSLKEEMSDDEISKYEEEALWTRARRQTAELKLQIMRGELHRSEDVRRVMNNMLASFRSRILVIPTKIAPLLLGKTDINPIKATLKDALYEALNELADYDPHVFYLESKDEIALEDEDSELLNDQVVEGSKKNGQRKKEK